VGCLLTLALGLLVAPLAAAAQPAGKVSRIGVLGVGLPPTSSAPYQNLERFRLALRDLRYIEGQNLLIEYRWGELKPATLPVLAAELVSRQVHLIVAWDTPSALAAKNATQTIPIVMTVFDPVGSGLVASLGRPGGNVTGISVMEMDVLPKRLELLREAVPAAAHVAIVTPGPPGPLFAAAIRATEAAAQGWGVQLTNTAIGTDPREWDHAFQAMVSNGIAAILPVQSPVFFMHRAYLVELAAKYRLPAMYQNRDYVEAGGLMSYGSDMDEVARRNAIYVDKLLKGAKPADLPVEQLMKFELVLNRKVAQALGITIPPTLLVLVDEVIQ
jgi:putative ABC transport system substrate-binding protein